MPAALVDDPADGAEVIPAPPDGFTRVNILGINLTAKGAVDVELVAGGTTVWKTYAMSDPNVYGGIVVPFDKDRDMGCPDGAAVTITLSAAVDVAGTIDYCYQ